MGAQRLGIEAALDQPARVPAELDLFLVAGDSIDTIAQLSVNSADGAVSVHSRAPGDGTALRASALLDERAGDTYRPMVDMPIAFRQVLFLPDEHLALTRSTIFRDNVLFWLLEDKRWH